MKLENLKVRVFNKFFKPKVKSRFPFKKFNELFPVSFEVNNSIEEFRLIDWGGEKEYVVKLIKDLREDDVVYDIGSSVGLISIISASVLKRGKVISFEPDPENILRLKRNYSINNLKNFEIKPIAVGERKGKLKLFTQGSNGFSPSLEPVNGINSFIETEVNSIDNLIRQNEIPFPDVIKMDIEGAEFLALKGMGKLLSSEKRPRLIFLEIHPKFLPSFNCSPQDIYDFLSQFDYKVVENVEREDQILCKLQSR